MYNNLHPEFVEMILETCSNHIPSKLHRDLSFTDAMVRDGHVTFNYAVFKTMRKYEVTQVWLLWVLNHMKQSYKTIDK